VFFFADQHVIEEGFLELVNNMLTTGMVPALYDEDGKKALVDSIRNEAKKKGYEESEMWSFFMDKVKENLHIVLCMSPAGDTLRIRCRNFPGLISSTSIDWYFPWPEDALQGVANYYLEDESLAEEHRENIISHIVKVHSSI